MNEQKREKEQLKKQKRMIIIIITSLIAFAILYYLISMIDFNNLFETNDGSSNINENIYFYDESLSKYPSEDEWYSKEAYKNIEYFTISGSTVFSETILTDKDAISKGEAFYLLYNYIQYIKAGDHESYNSCFSTYYFKNNPPQGKFTKQKIYDIKITEMQAESKSDGTNSFIEYTYTLEYRIRHNNGSLRKDIGSDQIKKQYIKLSNRNGMGILIDKIYTLNETVIA